MPLPMIAARIGGAVASQAIKAGARAGSKGGSGGTQVVNIRGIKELQAALHEVETKLPRELRVVFNEAARHVVGKAQPNVPRRTGRLAGSIKPLSTQRTGRVAYGTATQVPYAGFIEFGGQVGRFGTPVRPYERKGRHLFPAAEAERDPVIRDIEESLEKLIKRAGLG